MCKASSLYAYIHSQALKIIELINIVTNITAPKNGLWFPTFCKITYTLLIINAKTFILPRFIK